MRRHPKSKLLLAALLALLAGCDPGITNYRPASSDEKLALSHAQLNVYPDDVRNEPARYKNTMVAWAGVVVDSTLIEHPDNIEIELLLDHHYYTWEEIFFATWKQSIFLSPRGEGKFITYFFVAKDDDVEAMKRSFDTGNLVLVYGIPGLANDDIPLTVKATHLRAIDKRNYTFEKQEYGRDFHFYPHY